MPDAYLEMALAEFRCTRRTVGISFALTELAMDRIATRGEFAAACEYYEQAIAVVTEVGADRRCHPDAGRDTGRELYWLKG